MPRQTTNDSRSLRQQAAALELKLAGRHRRLRSRIDRIKQTMAASLASPTLLLVAFGTGVVLEHTSHRRKDSLAYLLNAGYAGVRMLASLSFAIRAANKSHQKENVDHVHPI